MIFFWTATQEEEGRAYADKTKKALGRGGGQMLIFADKGGRGDVRNSDICWQKRRGWGQDPSIFADIICEHLLKAKIP